MNIQFLVECTLSLVQRVLRNSIGIVSGPAVRAPEQLQAGGAISGERGVRHRYTVSYRNPLSFHPCRRRQVMRSRLPTRD